MAHIVILGAGIAGMSAAFELRAELDRAHRITVIGDGIWFSFTPSNPWVAVGWRKSDRIRVAAPSVFARRNIDFIDHPAAEVSPAENRIRLADGDIVDYDYLVIATGPRLAFDEIPGLGPAPGHTHSICTTPHAESAWQAYQAFLERPGPMVIGAAPGASCFGPAYEFAMIVDADLRKRKLRDRVPIAFVTSEPYIGHMGLAGVGDSRGLLETELRQRDIGWLANTRIREVKAGEMRVDELDSHGNLLMEKTLPFAYSMVIPAFTGVDALRKAEGLVNPRGFVLIDAHQRNPTYRNVFAAGVCVAIPPVETTPVPTGAPKTGFMIESMVAAIVANLKADLEKKPATAQATWNAVCLADLGSTGAAFVALPQIPPRNVTWARKGRWVRLAKLAFEKYFMAKMRSGKSEPVYEKYVMKALGIARLKPERRSPARSVPDTERRLP